MSPSYEREIEDGDQVADYAGDYRDPYTTRLYLMLEKKYAKTEALDALRVVKEYEVSLSEIYSPGWDFEKWTEDFSKKWRALDTGRKTRNPGFHDCMHLLTFLQESKIPMWKTYVNMYFLQHNQDPEYYVTASLLQSLQSHYRLPTHALNGSAPIHSIPEAKFMRFKKAKKKRKTRILAANALATLVEGNNICIRCNGSFKPLVSHHTWCPKCHSPKRKDAKALEAACPLPKAAAAQLLAKQNEKRKKKHATEKGRNLKKQRGNVAFVLPPGKVAMSKMAIRKKIVSLKSVANRAAIRAKDSSASVSKDVCESEHSDSDSGPDARDMRHMLHKSSDDSSAGDDSEEHDSSASVNSESASEDMTSSKDIRDVLMSYGVVKVPLCTSCETGSKSEEDASARLQA